MPTLTPRQKQIYEFLNNYSEKRGVSPTHKEIGKKFRLVVSTVHEHLSALEKKGYIKKERGHARTIEATKREEVVKIPIVGTIAAGQPIEAIEAPDKTIAVTQNEIGKFGNHYALRVQGNSMIGDGIFDGDIVVIRKQETADNGQTIVAIIDDNEATLKKIYREKGRIRLQPANQAMLPIYRKEVEVRGIVVKIVRNLENGDQDNTLAYNKRVFLDRIRSSNPNSQNKYKRVALSPIR